MKSHINKTYKVVLGGVYKFVAAPYINNQNPRMMFYREYDIADRTILWLL